MHLTGTTLACVLLEGKVNIGMTKKEIMENFGKPLYGVWLDVVLSLIQNGKTMEEAFPKADELIKTILSPDFNRPF